MRRSQSEEGSGAVNSGAERDAQLEARVREHLAPAETFRAAIWVSRAEGQAPVRITLGEISPFRFRRRRPERRGVNGLPRSNAVGLDEHLRTVNDPRVLALTDRRLMLLSQGAGSWRDLFPSASGPLPPLRPRWECPRADLASAVDQAGRLRLTFTDRSSVTLLTPIAGVPPFLADVPGV